LGNYKRKGWLMLFIFLTFGIFLILFSQSSWYLASLILMSGIGIMATGFDTMQHTLLQLNVNEEQRGRAMGIWMICIGVTPFGSMIVGALATYFGVQLALSINGIAIIATFVIIALFVPRIRKI
ncbi:MFS transporter, partial [Chloroflexota bacterium]